jgi:hypothetical protein
MFGWIAIRFQPATDQQLAGLVMWILGGSVYVIATLVFLALWIASSGKVPRPAFRQANIAYEDDVQNRQAPDRHLGLDIRGLAPTLLPRRDSAQRLAVMVRATVCHDRDQRLVLPHTIMRGRATMARAHAGELSLRLESIEIHHPLEAFDGAIG